MLRTPRTAHKRSPVEESTTEHSPDESDVKPTVAELPSTDVEMKSLDTDEVPSEGDATVAVEAATGSARPTRRLL